MNLVAFIRAVRELFARPVDALRGTGVEVTEGVLNKTKTAFRAYDPCFACAAHSLPGQIPMVMRVRDVDGKC